MIAASQTASGYLPVSDARYAAVVDFLFYEAELLDSGELDAWLNLLTDDVSYRLPVRLTRRRKLADAPAPAPETDLYAEDLASLRVRAARLHTDFAWAEDPPSRTRHLVANIRVRPTDHPAELAVRSNVLVYRNRGNSPQADLFSGERQDVLREVAGTLRLARRIIRLDQAVVGARNISILL